MFFKKIKKAKVTETFASKQPPQTGDATPHIPKAPPIRDTWRRRVMVLAMLKTTAWFYKREGRCTPISRHLIVKFGDDIDLTEAATMEYIAKNAPGVPVPRVYCAFEHKGQAYIVQERIRGRTNFFKTYYDLENGEEKERLLGQFKDICKELRSMPPPSPRIESCIGGTLLNLRLRPVEQGRFGPIQSVRYFHQWLRYGVTPEEMMRCNLLEREKQRMMEMIAWQDQESWPAPVFTHGDLHPGNILFRKGKIVGIIDWEFSGWFPYYWDYTTMCIAFPFADEWHEVLGSCVGTYPEELKMEWTRNARWGEIF